MARTGPPVGLAGVGGFVEASWGLKAGGLSRAEDTAGMGRGLLEV